MIKPLDLSGMRFGNWVAVEPVFGIPGQRRKWLCKCDCGVISAVLTGNLMKGGSTNCGCQKAIKSASNATIHGGAYSDEYKSWRGMRDRCSNANHSGYKYYGARGIQVCERWKLFENFLLDMGPRPVGSSIERIKLDGNYEPGNCRWATAHEQARNRSNTCRVEFEGRSICIADLAKTLRVHQRSLYTHYHKGKSIDQIVKLVKARKSKVGASTCCP
jgi:hypothetical protein